MLIRVDGGDPRHCYQVAVDKADDGEVEAVTLYLADPRQGLHALKVRRYEGEEARDLMVALAQHVIEV